MNPAELQNIKHSVENKQSRLFMELSVKHKKKLDFLSVVPISSLTVIIHTVFASSSQLRDVPVYNLSKFLLNDSHKQFLSKGLNFALTSYEFPTLDIMLVLRLVYST